MTNARQNKPIYDLSFVIEPERRGGKERWVRVGAAFPHDDGKGSSLYLDALPLAFFAQGTGKLVMRLRDTDREEEVA